MIHPGSRIDLETFNKYRWVKPWIRVCKSPKIDVRKIVILHDRFEHFTLVIDVKTAAIGVADDSTQPGSQAHRFLRGNNLAQGYSPKMRRG